MATLFSRSENDLAKTFMEDVKSKRMIQKPTELNSNKSNAEGRYETRIY